MNKTNKFSFVYFLFLFCCLLGGNLKAQDVHFSQVEYSPLTLNPALAGANSAFQGITNFRSQYGSFTTPYQTMAASIDGRFTEGIKNSKGSFGGGLNFYNDEMGDGNFTQTMVNISLAYQLMLNKKSRLGVGLSSGFGTCSANPNAGQWGTQYDGMAYNPLLASGESFYNQNFSYFDMGAGMLYTYRTKNAFLTEKADKVFNFGVSATHLNRPIYSFYNSSIQHLPVRYSVFANANIGLPASNGAFLPGVYYSRQKTSNEILAGFYYKQFLKNESRSTGLVKANSLYLGLFTRFKDAMILKAMIEWGTVSAGFAYDINISRLSTVTNFKGGMEVFVRYNLNEFKGSRKLRKKS